VTLDVLLDVECDGVWGGMLKFVEGVQIKCTCEAVLTFTLYL
jgi:hypothetical protein